jgi:hypothetical protein
VQRVTVKNAFASTQRVLRVLYPPGNDTVLDITVTATAGSNASMLLHPSLGLNTTVNGIGLPELVQVSGGRQAVAKLASMLQAALQVTALDVGVEAMPGQSADNATFRVAVPRSKVCRLSTCSLQYMSRAFTVRAPAATLQR